MLSKEELLERYKYTSDGRLWNRKTGKETGKTKSGGAGYVVQIGNSKSKTRKRYRAHRIIWVMHYGNIPEGYVIDHIDRNPFNNKIENLRLATLKQNRANSASFNKSGLPKGVAKQPSGKYSARISSDGKQYWLGTFKTIEEAKNAYNLKAKELYGEFALEDTK